MKRLLVFLVAFVTLSTGSLKAQYNPYLDKKKKNKPSAIMARQTKKDLKRQKKAAKRQLKRSRRQVHRK